MKIDKDIIYKEIDKTYNAIHKEIMYSIVDYLNEYDFVKDVDVRDIDDFTHNKFKKEDIIVSLQLFSLLKNTPMQIKFYFYENDDTELLNLTKDDVRNARANGYLTHPITHKHYSLDVYDKNILLNFEII